MFLWTLFGRLLVTWTLLGHIFFRKANPTWSNSIQSKQNRTKKPDFLAFFLKPSLHWWHHSLPCFWEWTILSKANKKIHAWQGMPLHIYGSTVEASVYLLTDYSVLVNLYVVYWKATKNIILLFIFWDVAILWVRIEQKKKTKQTNNNYTFSVWEIVLLVRKPSR